MAHSSTSFASDAMQQTLKRNREGRLTPQQWIDIVTQPVITLLLLLVPALVLVAARSPLLLIGGRWLLLLLIISAIVVPLVTRARRYARLPVQFRVLYAGERLPGLFNRKMILYDESGERLKFDCQYAPTIAFDENHAYATYYLQDGARYLLLSAIRADEPEAEAYYPSRGFEARHMRRAEPTIE